jgi:hypothetical protein
MAAHGAKLPFEPSGDTKSLCARSASLLSGPFKASRSHGIIVPDSLLDSNLVLVRAAGIEAIGLLEHKARQQRDD